MYREANDWEGRRGKGCGAGRRLRKLTCGLLWKDTPEYVVVVGDYDITNEGRDYRHNDFHIIPRGVIRQLTYLRESSTPLVALQAEASAS